MTSVNSDAIWTALRSVIDPELRFNIVELGLVYDIQVSDSGVTITMTLTTPTCPLQDHFRQSITAVLQPLVPSGQIELVFTFDPRWSLAKAEPDIQQHFALLGIPLSGY